MTFVTEDIPFGQGWAGGSNVSPPYLILLTFVSDDFCHKKTGWCRYINKGIYILRCTSLLRLLNHLRKT